MSKKVTPRSTAARTRATINLQTQPLSPVPSLVAPAYVTAGQSYPASVAAPLTGSTYSWTITGGTISGSSTGPTISFAAGTAGTVSLDCIGANAAGNSAPAGTATCTIVAAPSVPAITVPTDLTAGAPLNGSASFAIDPIPTIPTIKVQTSASAGQSCTASVSSPQVDSTYHWTLSNGTPAPATGTQITFTAGASGAVA